MKEYTERVEGYQIRDVLYFGKPPENAPIRFDIVKWFRRTLATNMARHGMPVQEVAAILGHEKIDTTMKYVVLNKDDIKSSYRRFA